MRTIHIPTLAILATTLAPSAGAESWRALTVAAELNDKCPKYSDHEADYDYDRDELLERIRRTTDGDLYSPYTGRTFSQESAVHVEHIVARKEAHYSGLCLRKNAHRRKEFASDLLNLTIAGKGLNQAKRDCDASTWTPPLNRCWFANQVVEVRKKYSLTVDERERDALAGILSNCKGEQLSIDRDVEPAIAPLMKWDTDGNGQISCTELAGKVQTPIRLDHEAYPFVSDANCDGTVC